MPIVYPTQKDFAKKLNELGEHAPNYFLIVGPELYLQREATESVQKAADTFYTVEEHYTFGDDEYDFTELKENANNPGLFAMRRYYKFLISKKPTSALLKKLQQIANLKDRFHIYLFVFTQAAEKEISNSGFYRSLAEQNAFCFNCEKLPAYKFRGWIEQRLREFHFDYENKVVDELEYRFENNLFTLVQILTQLQIRGLHRITAQDIEEASEVFADYNLFDLMTAVLEGNLARANQMLEYLVFEKGESLQTIIGVIRKDMQYLYYCSNVHDVVNDDVGIQQLWDLPICNGYISAKVNNMINTLFLDKRKRAAVTNQLKFKLTRPRLCTMLSFISDIEVVSKTRDTPEQVVQHLKNFFMELNGRKTLQGTDLFLAELEL